MEAGAAQQTASAKKSSEGSLFIFILFVRNRRERERS
jgi:hypothetical protein